jgi:hypothetical protein
VISLLLLAMFGLVIAGCEAHGGVHGNDNEHGASGSVETH